MFNLNTMFAENLLSIYKTITRYSCEGKHFLYIKPVFLQLGVLKAYFL